MDTLSNLTRYVGTADRVVCVVAFVPKVHEIVRRDGESQLSGVITDNVDWAKRQILSWNCSVEVDQRHVVPHRIPQVTVLVKIGVCTAIAVVKEVAVCVEGIRVPPNSKPCSRIVRDSVSSG